MAKINSRAKGSSGERELIGVLTEHLGAEITGNMKRNLEQTRGGGHDLVGLDGWAIEVKRYKQVSEGDMARFWEQTVTQAYKVMAKPVLAFREDFRSWRVVIPISVVEGKFGYENGLVPLDYTAEMSVAAFSYIVRESWVAP